jgi:hypothetical protein
MRSRIRAAAGTRLAAAVVLALGLVPGLPTPAGAATYPAFGPERFVRTTGGPTVITRTFSALDPGAVYTLQIVNGAGNTERLSSAVITLNGVVIAGPSDFNQHVELFEKPVRLAALNTLVIELRSAPGSAFDVIVLGTDNVPPTITATASRPPNAAGWNNTDVTVTFNCADERSGIAFCSPPVEVSREASGLVLVGTAFDTASNRASVQVVLNIDKTRPVLAFNAPAAGQSTNTASVLVRMSATDANGIAAVNVQGIPASPAGGFFEATVPLSEGSNTLTATVRDVANNVQSASLQVIRFALPEMTISSPAPQTLTRFASTTVEGSVSANVRVVSVNGVTGTVSGTSFSVPGVPLFEGNNLLTVVASDASGRTATAAVQVIRDSTAPRIVIHAPAEGLLTSADKVTVSGMVNDLIVGSLDVAEAGVDVSGVPASVANRNFLATNVPLALGVNTLIATATDLSGNTGTTTITVRRVEAAGPRISIAGGDLQKAPIQTELPQPLVVTVTDALGHPSPGQEVVFRVVESNGSLRTPAGSGPMALETTDAQGQAKVQWTLGTRGGAGRDRVEVNAPGIVGGVVFTATALAAVPARINVDAGNLQYGVVGRELPRPLVVVVTDAGHNRLPGVPVTFRVAAGGGSFAGQSAVVVETDAYGRALTAFTLGIGAGRDTNLVEANFEANPGSPVTFAASSLTAGDPAATRVSGVVLDNSDRPIEGVSVRIEETALSARTNQEGLFTIAGAPAGRVRLSVDGGTAERPGTWPGLEYELVTVPGQDNTVGMPIYLLPLDLARGIVVDEARGGKITLPELPGFSLTIAPGSASFPGGSKSGVVSVTLVHADKVPMVPNFGQQPRFIVTIQPAGVRFDPPAAMTMPNVDGLAPGQVTEMYSFDHDLGMFVSIGTATVSADGSILRSDPGVGVIEGGWHCGGNPAAAGGAASVSVSISTSDPQKLKKDDTKTLTASGGPQPGSYSWSTDRPDLISFVGPTSGPGASSVTIKALKSGKARVTVVYTCDSGASDQDDIKVLVATPDVTVVAWVNAAGPEAVRQALEGQAGFLLKLDLQGPLAFATCGATLLTWSLGIPIDLLSDTDRRYANAFLLANSGNSPPAGQIDPASVQSGGDFRLFNRLQAIIDPDVPHVEFLQQAAAVGTTPNPCPLGPSADGETHPSNGANGFTTTNTGVYQLAEGRLGSLGQKVNKTLNGGTTPWIWSVIRFNLQSELDPMAIDRAIFPTYYLYQDGQLIAVFPQPDHESFILLNDTYQRVPGEIR